MNSHAADYQCHLLDTPYGLKIFFKGRVNKKIFSLFSLFALLPILSGCLMSSGMLYKGIFYPGEDIFLYRATFSFILALLVYLLCYFLPIIIDQLLLRDTVTINAHHIHIQKSGFLSLARYREFSTSSNRYFQAIYLYRENRIIFSGSITTAKQVQSDFHLLSPSPMRTFCRGIEFAEAEEIVALISSRYPYYGIHSHQARHPDSADVS